MAKTKTAFRCTECGATAPRWLGRCLECGEWNTLVEETAVASSVALGALSVTPVLAVDAERARPISQVDPIGAAPIPTGVAEFDRVLGGGLVAGSVTLLGGEPGMGKSTLLLQVGAGFARRGLRTLLVSAEESSSQVRARAGRLDALADELLLVHDTSMSNIAAHVSEHEPQLLLVDSIQTIADSNVPGAPGSLVQVRECAQQLVRLAKRRNLTVVLVGHVTKEGSLAGPRVLEHVVDTVLHFDGDQHHALRLVHASKHRFGPTQELGVFEMDEQGLVGVSDASALFLADRRAGAYGSVVTPVLEGSRSLLVEIQALLVPGPAPVDRRVAQGLDSQRLAVLLAVLDRRGRCATAGADVFTSVAGGVRVRDTAADLAVAVAVASARREVPIAADVVVLGELGLGGELRQVSRPAQRLREAARLGFTRAVVPAATPDVDGCALMRVRDLPETLAVLGLHGPGAS
ncbi:MAG: DNA repair protein RadA [Acidimicrobiia bacterium]